MDNSQSLQSAVESAYLERNTLAIKGGSSKEFYGHCIETDYVLETASHQGIVDYHPNELVLTARAGTPLSEIEACLAEQGQMLSCEAPHFANTATFGGMIAAGISGPRRPYGGSISDLVLGCKILNGKGQIMQFGGKVMKNVAGYDHSRLMVGAMGCLGVILEASMKVVPVCKAESTFRFKLETQKITQFINKLTSLGYPVSGTAYDREYLLVRFSAGEQEISDLPTSLNNEFAYIEFEEELMLNYWQDLREQKMDFFKSDKPLWRFSMAANTAEIELEGEVFIEYGGAQRWIKTDESAETVFKIAKKLNASATLFKSQQQANATHIFQPLSEPLMQWQHQLKQAFDPAGILNPGRLYRGL